MGLVEARSCSVQPLVRTLPDTARTAIPLGEDMGAVLPGGEGPRICGTENLGRAPRSDRGSDSLRVFFRKMRLLSAGLLSDVASPGKSRLHTIHSIVLGVCMKACLMPGRADIHPISPNAFGLDVTT